MPAGVISSVFTQISIVNLHTSQEERSPPKSRHCNQDEQGEGPGMLFALHSADILCFTGLEYGVSQPGFGTFVSEMVIRKLGWQ
jgi:hypothetical protein